MSHLRATSGPGNQYSIHQSISAVGVHAFCKPGVLMKDEVEASEGVGWMASMVYASNPVGESHSAYATVCGRSGTIEGDPGVSGGVMP